MNDEVQHDVILNVFFKESPSEFHVYWEPLFELNDFDDMQDCVAVTFYEVMFNIY